MSVLQKPVGESRVCSLGACLICSDECHYLRSEPDSFLFSSVSLLTPALRCLNHVVVTLHVSAAPDAPIMFEKLDMILTLSPLLASDAV